MACVPNSVTNLSIIFFPFCKCFKCSFRHLVRRPPTSPKNLFKCQWRSGIHGPPHIPGAGTPKPTVQGGPSAAPPPPTPHRPTTVCMRTRPRCAGGPQSGMRQLRRPGGPSASACREAGATVARNVALADMNIADAVLDGRRIEIVANGLHAYHGQQLAIDTTCVSPLTRTGQPHPGTTTEPGRALAQAVARKRRRYPELLAARSRCKLLAFAIEVGGRWGPEAQRLLRQLARQRAQEAPAWLRRAAPAGWQLVGYRGGRRPTRAGHLAPRVANSRRHPRRPRAGPAGPPR